MKRSVNEITRQQPVFRLALIGTALSWFGLAAEQSIMPLPVSFLPTAGSLAIGPSFRAVSPAIAIL